MRAGLLARAVALAVFAAGATLTPQAARAAFVEHIFEAGTTNLLGTISLPTISGTSAAGVALSLNMFTEADICTCAKAPPEASAEINTSLRTRLIVQAPG